MMKISNNRRRRVSLGTIVAVLIVVLLVGAAALWREGLQSTLWQVLSPIAAARNAFFSTDSSTLRDELARANAALADRQLLEQENKELRAMVGRSETQKRVMGAILARPPFSPYDTLVIDVGTVHGVAVGSTVYAGGSSALGVVTSVDARTSQVTLYSAPGEEHDALLRGTIPMQLAGQGGGSFVAEIPAGTEVAVGDAVTFPGLSAALVGKVAYVEEKPGESFTMVYMALPVNFQELRFVEVSLQ